jgi:hypothetical protein
MTDPKKARIWLPIGPSGPGGGGPEARFDRDDVRGLGGTGPQGIASPYFVWTNTGGVPGEFMVPGLAEAAASTANPALGAIVVPFDGTLQTARLQDKQATHTSSSDVVLYKNGVATAIACGYAAGGDFGVDNVNTVAVLQGDLITVLIGANADPAHRNQFMCAFRIA